MSKTLLVGDQSKLFKMYALNLNTYVGTEVISLKNHQDVFQFLDLVGSVDLIITKASIEGAETASLISQYLQAKNHNTPLCILGEEPKLKDCPDIYHLEAGVEIKLLLQTSAKILGVTAKQMVEQVVGDYYPIPLQYFLGLSAPICDVFLRIKKSDNDYQYIKRMHAGEVFEQDVLEKYKKEGISKLYVPSTMRLQFTNSITKQVLDRLNNPNTTPDEKIQILDQTTAITYIKIHEEGLNEETVQLAEACISHINKTVETYPRLGKLLTKLIEQKTGYMYTHCQIINHLINYLIDASDWGNSEQKEKMGFVTFFHDIAFAAEGLDTNKLVQIETEEQMKKTVLSAKEFELVQNHALVAMKLVNEFAHAPIGADIIIKQHHGSQTGVGFVENIPSSISYLAVVFTIAEHLTRIILRLDSLKDVNMPKIVDEISKGYRNAKHVKILNSLRTFKF